MTSSAGHAGEDSDRQRSRKPFARLVRHCIDRVMHGGGEAGPGELDFGIGALLAVLAAPGAFVSVFMVWKYGPLFQFLHGVSHFNAYAASLPDEYFFIVLAMVVTGAVAVWKWDALIPDRRDYVNLAPLPIPSKHILYANMTALLLLAAVLALDVNAVSAVLFPLVATGLQSSMGYTAVFFATHLLSVFLASVFSFFIVLAILGTMMMVLPYGTFRRCSVYVRCGMIVFLMAVLSTSFAMTGILEHMSRTPRPFVELLSPAWFAGLCQHLRGLKDPVFAVLAKTAVIATAAVLALALGAYALSYRRCFAKSSKSISHFAAVGRAIRRSRLRGVTDLFLRTPFERACFRFTLRTLFRSEDHTLIVGGFTGIGIVLASEVLFQAAAEKNAEPSAAALSIPLVVIYLLLLGLRFSFEVPVILRANWIFRLRTNPDASESVGLARKVMLTFLVPLLLAVCLPAYGSVWSWRLGVIHTCVVAAASILLIEILLVRFRKIPFTCSAPHFKSNILVSILFYFLGFVVFTSWVPVVEEWAFEDSVWYAALLAALAAIWLVLQHYRGELKYIEKRLIFEEQPDTSVERLDLTFSR
ncbi:MAG TPA: hypothetical protein VGR36_02925 [Candidatus Acidoferrales bacterium]|nr:hypothetical protein [Candidatus Acidoferrales bacterium]